MAARAAVVVSEPLARQHPAVRTWCKSCASAWRSQDGEDELAGLECGPPKCHCRRSSRCVGVSPTRSANVGRARGTKRPQHSPVVLTPPPYGPPPIAFATAAARLRSSPERAPCRLASLTTAANSGSGLRSPCSYAATPLARPTHAKYSEPCLPSCRDLPPLSRHLTACGDGTLGQAVCCASAFATSMVRKGTAGVVISAVFGVRQGEM